MLDAKLRLEHNVFCLQGGGNQFDTSDLYLTRQSDTGSGNYASVVGGSSSTDNDERNSTLQSSGEAGNTTQRSSRHLHSATGAPPNILQQSEWMPMTQMYNASNKTHRL